MTIVDEDSKAGFFQDVEAAAKKSTWCALATVAGNQPRVRMVHPTWEGDTLWIATGPQTAKVREMQENSAVDLQYQVAPDDFVHLMIRGTATVLTDEETKALVWDVMDYDLYQFWPDGPRSEEFCVIKIEPARVELSEMFGTMNKRVWRA